jgi:pyridoxamine 5'-phosphate oxidase
MGLAGYHSFMPNWIEELKRVIAQEGSGKPIIVTLATVRVGGVQPGSDARSVVVRQVLEDGTLLITSDARSQKNAQLRANPSATAVFWFRSQRWQFIIDGEVKILRAGDPDTAAQRQAAWRDLSGSSRALFLWPPPGEERREEAVFEKSVSAEAAVPPTFEVLLLQPARVETLDLNPHPHLRVRWDNRGGAWESLVVNP